jgi:hypothetical protein
MDPSRVNRILKEWSAIANQARRPSASPERFAVRGGMSGATLAGASLVVVAFVIAVVWLGRPGPNGGVGSVASASPSATATATETPSPTAIATPAATPSPTLTPTPKPTSAPTPTPTPTTGPCDPAKLAARITLWEGAAGHRIAHVELTNAGTVSCTLRAMAKPQLVDGKGSVLIDGMNPPASALLTVTPGQVLKTLVQDANYCGPAPVAPVSVAFVLSGGGRIVATPVSPTDTTLPPCNGPGSPADVEMQPWAP